MGRPKEDGERYPGGKLKPDTEIAPALYARYRNDVLKFFNDPKLASQVTRLELLGQLTKRQAAAGLKLGEIFNRWRRLKRLRSSPKSPNYEGGFSGGADLAEERMTDEQIEGLEDAIRKAREEYDRVSEELPVYPREVYAAIIELCVEDQPVCSVLYPEIRTQLNRLALLFDVRDKRKRRSSRGGVRPLRTKVEESPKAAISFRPPDATLRAVEMVVRRLRPDLGDDDLRQVKDTVAALVARERVRAQKARAET